MNTFDIFLKGGQVVTLETAHTLQDLINFIYHEDEREILLNFKDLTIMKSHISAIKDVTKKQDKEPIAEYVDRNNPSWLVNSVPAQFKPWDEQK